MKNIMRKLLIILSLMMSMTTISFSSTISEITDSVVIITPTQLKQANLIFADHARLIKENSLLKDQVELYKESNYYLVNSDSIKSKQINLYKDLNNSLTKDIKKKHTNLLIWQVGGISVCSGLLILLLLK